MSLPRASLCLSALVLCGCEPDCPRSDEIDGDWQLTAIVLDHTGGDDPVFPSYRSPANGTRTWTLQWGDALDGPVSIVIGDQSLDGTGSWDSRACGAFVLGVQGPYTSPSGSTHLLDGTLSGVLWDGRLDGSYTWSEFWTARDGADTGMFQATGRFEAVRP